MKNLIASFFLLFTTTIAFSQTGLTVGPPRLYFVGDAGQAQTQYVDVTNPSKDYTLELGVSFEDWSYSAVGDNELSPKGTLPTSCASWLSVSESYFSLKPGESKRLQLNMQVPKDAKFTAEVPVHTAMLFVTQLNPRAREKQEGANIRLAVRSGVKVYHRFNGRETPDLEITNLVYKDVDSAGQFLEVSYDVTGNIWLEGRLRAEFLNQETGEKAVVDNLNFYCLPGDKRKQYIAIPKSLKSGSYLVSVLAFYGDQDVVKIAELEFKHVAKN
ncbi:MULTISPECIES: fimbrial biogenesis chaperone [Sphingobacterium]|uniref:fimbrial biogenesis chaperone n=1 Tax=Sphingobacterium TaxID=28453 RepID=UPI0028173790|nr:hypothetical protein [Sphingobacterium multivorum]MDR2273410.1 hypothetical protein [Sphingobacterium sp.]